MNALKCYFLVLLLFVCHLFLVFQQLAGEQELLEAEKVFLHGFAKMIFSSEDKIMIETHLPNLFRPLITQIENLHNNSSVKCPNDGFNLVYLKDITFRKNRWDFTSNSEDVKYFSRIFLFDKIW